MKITKRKILVVVSLCLFVIFLSAALFSAKHLFVKAEEKMEGKIYCTATLEDDFADDCVIVTLQSSISKVNKVHNKSFFKGIDIDSIEDLTKRERNFTVNNDFRQVLKIKLEEHSKEAVLNSIRKLEQIKGIYCAEPNFISKDEAIPNDSDYSKQWGMSSVYAPTAWNYTTGNQTVRVGVIDTGIANHPDLNANLISGYDYHNNNSITNDDESGHGTHVAGIIGAVGNNGQGVAGINWNVKLVSLQTSYWNEEKSNYFHLSESRIAAINWASDRWGTDEQISVINHSIGGFGTNVAIRNAVANFPGLFVWSAGNDGKSVDAILDIDKFNLGNLISVGALSKNEDRWEKSNYGDSVSIFAPGAEIYSTFPNSKYSIMSGTSMAAPHVTGVAALLLSLDPTLTGKQLKEKILQGSDSITISTPDGNQIVKKLNAFGAMQGASPDEFFTKSSRGYYQLKNERDLELMKLCSTVYMGSRELSYSYELANDITLSGEWTPIPTKFTGIFDGNGHSIRNMNIHVTKNDLPNQNYGFFSRVSGRSIWDLTFENCNITTDNISNNDYTYYGVVAGSINDVSIINVTLLNCNITCRVSKSVVGAITGYMSSGSIYQCEVKGGVYDSSGFSLGGMVGWHHNGLIHDSKCETKLKVNSTENYGELIAFPEKAASYGVQNCETNVTIDKPCVAAGTLITLADGRQVPVETLTGNEMLLVWNLETGSFDAAPILFIDSDPWQSYKVIDLAFSDGTSVKVIYEHGFWDYDLNKYIYLDDDAAQYIGHWFNKQGTDGNGNFMSQRVQLTGVTVRNEYTASYSPVTYGHLCYYVNGMLSMPGGIEGMFNIFEVDAETMRYDEEKMQAEIEKYGLFTYEEFAELVPVTQEVFEAFNGEYLKVAIGKGLIDCETLNRLAERYAEYLN